MPARGLPKERFLPFRAADLVALCLGDTPEAERGEFGARIDEVRTRIHLEVQSHREALKELYAPLARESDLRHLKAPTEQEQRACAVHFEERLLRLLGAANFEEISRAELEDALGRASLFHVRLEIAFEDFEVLKLFRRGASRRSESVPRGPFKLFPRTVEFVNYDRVLFYGRFKGREYFDAQPRKNLPFAPGATILKLFRNIPRGDLEMLFPNSEIRMRTLDKLLIGVPAILGGMTVLTSKLLSAFGASLLLLGFWVGLRDEEVQLDEAATLALFGGLLALGTHSFRQFDKFKNRRIRFMKALTESLYYKTIDSDAGVFLHLLDVAEESEQKEALLALHFLRQADGPLEPRELDRRIEAWFVERLDCAVDFDVEDALDKLARFGLARSSPAGWELLPADSAQRGPNP